MGSGIILMLFRFPVVNLKIGISQYCFELQSCYAQFWKPETHTGYDLIHEIIQKSEIIKSETQKMKILTLNLQVNNLQLLYLRMVFTQRGFIPLDSPFLRTLHTVLSIKQSWFPHGWVS